MLKKILIGLAVLIVAVFLIGFLLPGKMEVSRGISVNAPVENVFEEFNDLKKWQEWQYWNTLEKPDEMKLTFGEKTVGTGAWYSWDGKKTGQGKITITESVPNKSVASAIEFTGSGGANGLYTVEPEGDATKVMMNFTFDNRMNPIGRWFSLFMKGEIEKAFDFGLARIKERAEAKPTFKTEISETSTPVINYIGIPTGAMNTEDEKAMSAVMEKLFNQLAADVARAKIQIAGPALCLVTRWDETAKQTEMICAFPVAADAQVPANYKVQQVPAGNAVKAVHKGDYAALVNAHMEIDAYMKSKNLTMAGNPWESYVTDPMMEKDTAKWITEIYYPIQ